uniref:Claudin-like protein n=1 Tax=Syphacia muris TaxID=451379 RepID=A0A0N5AIP5_9BILA
MLATLGLTLGAMFSPGWTDTSTTYSNVFEYIEHPKALFGFLCGSDSFDEQQCHDYFDRLAGWSKAVVVLMCVAVVIEGIALIWNLFTICACCCKRYVIHPLPALALLLTIVLAVALILFGVNNRDSIGFMQNTVSVKLGYSFYLACGAVAGAVIDVIVGAIAVGFAEKNL